MECRRPTSRDLNAALSAMQFQISPLKMEAAGVNRSANSAEYTRCAMRPVTEMTDE
jgi:hypothetical protein